MGVTGDDARRVMQFLDAARSSPPGLGLPRPVLTALADIIPADQVDYFERTSADQVVAATTAFDEADTSWISAIPKSVLDQNPLSYCRWAPADGPLRMSSVIAIDDLKRLAFYDAFLRPAGIRDRLRVWLYRSAAAVACVTLVRSDRLFSDRDTAILAVLQPHLMAFRERGERGVSDSSDPWLDDPRLTIREVQVMTMAATGRSNKEIGRALSVAPDTVRKHLEHAYAKTRTDGRAEAAAWLRSPPSRD